MIGQRRTTVLRGRALRLALVLGLLVLALGPMTPGVGAAGVVGDGTPGSCSEAALNTALGGGGTVTFNCGPHPVTIGITSMKEPLDGTTIDGGGKVTISGDDAVRVFLIETGTEVTLQNLTVSNGRSNAGGAIYNRGTLTLDNSTVRDSHSTLLGGGIENFTTGMLTLINSTVSGNVASNEGGGILNRGTLTLTNSIVSENRADVGGGIMNSFGTVTVTNSTVSGNEASDGGGIENWGTLELTNSSVSGNEALERGGGINNVGTLNLDNSTVSGNSASSAGGGIMISFGTVTVTNSTVSGNEASDGGGIRNSASGTVTVTNSTVKGNTSTGDGGGIYASGVMQLTNSTVSGNTASINGGGIFVIGMVTVTNSTISGNEARDGGGIVNRGTLRLTSSTVSGNSATLGGGIYNAHSLHLASSLVAGNSAPTGPDVSGTVAAGSTYNLIGNGANMSGLTHGTNGNLVGVDPKLGPLADNGGPTKTHALVAGSPALDHIPAGTNGCGDETATLPILTDQRGMSRPQGAGCDIGAFEVEVQEAAAYQFSGFLAPVSGDMLNVAKAGQVIPLRFHVTDANDAPVTDLSAVGVKSAPMSCSAVGSAPDPVEEYATGKSGLLNQGNGYYQFNWVTQKNFANTCRQLQLTLGEDTETVYTANFQFTR